MDIDVCVCTFRRPSLRETLRSIAQQDLPAGMRVRVIVADNDETPSAAALVDAARAEFGLDLHYVHAPARNISIARNACLDAARAEFVAFVDDDEIAPPHWLAALHAGLEHLPADVVFGPVRAIYPADAPAWVIKGDFHSFGPVRRAHGAIDTGYSSNVLMRRALIGATRFEPALGKTGGEDTFFFATLYKAGARLEFCPEAYVEEPTPLARARFDWLMKRAFRSGQTHARVLAAEGKSAFAIAGLAGAKALYSGASAIISVFDGVKRRRALLRGALHLGVVAKAFGASDLQLYGAPAPR